MPVFENILLPVDFSASARALLPAAAALGQQFIAPVTLLHALDALRPELEVADTALLAQLEDRARQKLAAFGGASNIRGEVVPGPPAAAIVEFARQLSRPLIMMPTRGESAFRRLLLGSVAASVLHDAECPVWTSAHREDGGPLPTGYGTIVCAVDLEAHTADVLSQAREFAAAVGARLHVLHSVPGIDPRFDSATAQRAHGYLLDTARAAWPALASQAGVEPAAFEIIEDIGLAEGIAAAVERHGADLLVIGRGASQGVLGRLRTNAHELIRQSRRPVLSV